ncbi:MAG TPA: WD40 repeat domain-containing serine/threonine-protein kinase [Verrucomicrobiae bacterium]|nr:WD40 repeat domain-containing serine/threonine-protein kinase [Verrucomicrobiae bacterium]
MVPADAPRGLCPACLVRLCLDDETSPEESSENPEQADEEPERERWDDYELLEEIGRGGMGIVYRARQVSLGRIVALKLLTPARLLSKSDLERFRLEAATVATLDHPNILPVHGFGRKAASWYYAMRLAEGGNLAERIERGEFRPAPSGGAPENERLRQQKAIRLIVTLARAAEYAHQRGVVHRDLKPANILLDAREHVYLADFGLAKVIAGNGELTRTSAIVGTPSYMAPEQCGRANSAIGAAVDIYSLGVMLYEMLAGRLPFAGGTALEVLGQIANDDPVPPARLNHAIPADLEAICLKCLEKQPERRYGSAAKLADDLERFLRHEPTLARPLTAFDKARRWSRRQPLAATLLILLLIAVVGGAAVSGWLAGRAAQYAAREKVSRRAAEQAARQVQGDVFKATLDQAQAELKRNHLEAALAQVAWLLRQKPQSAAAASWERFIIRKFIAVPIAEEPVFEQPPVMAPKSGKSGPSSGLAQSDRAAFIAFCASSRTLLTGASNGQLNIFSADKGRFLAGCRLPAPIQSAEFDAQGRSVEALAGDRLYLWTWESASRNSAPVLLATNTTVAHFSPNAAQLAAGFADGQVACWNVGEENPIWRIAGHRARANALAWCHDGSLILTGGDDRFCRIWNSTAGTRSWESNLRTLVKAVACSRDGKLFAAGGRNGASIILDTQTHRVVSPVLPLSEPVASLAFNPGTPQLMIVGENGLLQLWNLRDFAKPRSPKPWPTREAVASAPFTEDGRLFAACSGDGRGLLWESFPPAPVPAPIVQESGVQFIAISPDGHRAASLSKAGILSLWSLPQIEAAQPGATFPDLIRRAAICGTNGTVVAIDSRHQVTVSRILQDRTGLSRLAVLGSLPGRFSGLECGPSGRWFALWDSNEFSVWRSPAPAADLPGDLGPYLKVPMSGHPIALAFSSSGTHVALGTAEGKVLVYQLAENRLVLSLTNLPATELNLSPSGERLLAVLPHGHLEEWSVESGVRMATAEISGDGIRQAIFSHDGNHVAVTTDDRLALVLDAVHLKLAGEAMRHERPLVCVCFSEDDRKLAVTDHGGFIKTWDWRPGQASGVSAPFTVAGGGGKTSRLPARFRSFPGFCDPEFNWAATFGEDHCCRVWSLGSGLLLLPELDGLTLNPSFSPDGRWLLVTSGKTMQVYPMSEDTGPAPGWLPDFIEEATGYRFTPNGHLVLSHPKTISALRQKYPLAALRDRTWLPLVLR